MPFGDGAFLKKIYILCIIFLGHPVVSTLGLRGRHHPAIMNMVTSREVKLSRAYMKIISGNYLTYAVKASQSGGSPHCRICNFESESISHVVTACSGMASIRQNLFIELRQLCMQTKNKVNLDEMMDDEQILCQFLLDPSSLNLKSRVSLSDPIIQRLFKFSREYCYIIDKTRTGILQEMEKNKLGMS